LIVGRKLTWDSTQLRVEAEGFNPEDFDGIPNPQVLARLRSRDPRIDPKAIEMVKAAGFGPGWQGFLPLRYEVLLKTGIGLSAQGIPGGHHTAGAGVKAQQLHFPNAKAHPLICLGKEPILPKGQTFRQLDIHAKALPHLFGVRPGNQLATVSRVAMLIRWGVA
jgi:hypothetical protein